jgi:hypothetical protein
LPDFFPVRERAADNGEETVVNERYSEEDSTAIECGEGLEEDSESVTFQLTDFPEA